MAKKKAKKKKPAKKKVAKKKKPAKKKPAKKKKAKRKPNAAFMAAVKPDDALAKIVGAKPLPRTQIVKKLWVYFKKHKLQDAKNRRAINADANLKPVFGKNQITMFEVGKIIKKHTK